MSPFWSKRQQYWWKGLWIKELKISVRKLTYTRFSKAAQKKDNWILPRQRWSLMSFTCFLGTLGRYCSRPKFNGLRTNSSTLEEILIPQRTLVELPVYIGEMDWFWEERWKIKPVRQSFQTLRPIFLDMTQRRRELMMISQFDKKTPCITAWKNHSKCSVLGTIVESAGSRIGILADSHLQSWPTQGFLEIALIVWYL